jgi:hypothetical protein
MSDLDELFQRVAQGSREEGFAERVAELRERRQQHFMSAKENLQD